ERRSALGPAGRSAEGWGGAACRRPRRSARGAPSPGRRSSGTRPAGPRAAVGPPRSCEARLQGTVQRGRPRPRRARRRSPRSGSRGPRPRARACAYGRPGSASDTRRCARAGPRRGRGPARGLAERTRELTSRLSYAPSEAGVRVNAQDVRHIGVVGCGLMGSGIVEVCARAGLQVTFAEGNADLIAAGRARIERSLDAAVSKGKLEPIDREAALGRIDAVDDVEALAVADLVN